MKKIIVLGLLAFTVSGIIRSQITFTVKPGLNLNSANIGIKSENFLPYFGLQFLNIIDIRIMMNTTQKIVKQKYIFICLIWD